jgi:hypothetical protein
MALSRKVSVYALFQLAFNHPTLSAQDSGLISRQRRLTTSCLLAAISSNSLGEVIPMGNMGELVKGTAYGKGNALLQIPFI